jgi:DNA polymerase-3 subunit gamma/tau
LAHISLYRKYRSQTFGDLIGQDHVVRTLQNAVGSERIAHAYLFTGPRGTGKTSTARLLAKALNCEKGPTATPCNECDQCMSITIGNNPDVYEMDAASESGVEEVREKIVEVAEYLPMSARYKVFIIDEVHDLSGKAFDALLKTVEEPPQHVVFILATTEYNKVPPTIRSRCQNYEFHRGTLKDLVSRLEYVAREEKVDAEPAALDAIARMADGGFRDALTLLEQAMLTSDGQVTLEHVYEQLGLIPEDLVDGLLSAIRESDPARIMELSAEVARRGRDPRSILESMEYRLADLTRAAYGVDVGGSLDSSREAALHETATRLGKDMLLALRSAIAEAHKFIRDVSLPRLWLEAELIRISRTLSPGSAQPAAPTPAAAPVTKPKAAAPPKAAEKAVVTNGAASVRETPAPEPAAPIASADPALAPLQDLWNRAIAHLATNTAMYMKLHDAKVVGAEGSALTVQVPRNIDCEWVMEKPVRFNHVLKLLKDEGGRDYSVTYVAGGGAVSDSSEAVELPAEGPRLEKLAKDILGTA